MSKIRPGDVTATLATTTTDDGSAPGTFRYKAPELIPASSARARAPSKKFKSDVWPFGLLCFVIAAPGTEPYQELVGPIKDEIKRKVCSRDSMG
jgi:serine/threonine protein kinase